MSHRIILSPGARADIKSAVRWYQREDIKLSLRFRVETQVTLRRIAQNPNSFPLLRGTIRRALMNKFPYSVYFSANTDEVLVRAVLHQRRFNLWCKR